ncbi:MAG: DUF4079 family protein [Synechococcaceae cyanobacterium]|nr:DUF4079 family protein [Synechococcaceae cyanobacterium]
MPSAISLSPVEALALVHPLLMVLFIYPVAAVTVRLAIHVRERRLGLYPLPASVLLEHAQHGQWLTSAVVVAMLTALLWGLVPEGQMPLPAEGAPLLLVSLASLIAALTLWWVQRLVLRVGFALLSWIGLLTLSLQPGLSRGSAPALNLEFLGSHLWGGLLLSALLLLSTSLRPAIGRRPALRRLHSLAAGLVALLMVTQAISGCRTLLLLRAAG